MMVVSDRRPPASRSRSAGFFSLLTLVVLVQGAAGQPNLPTPEFPEADGGVRSLLLAGDVVYVGGEFTAVGGVARNGLAAVDLATCEVTDWDPDVDGTVLALAASATTVYAGGMFDQVGGALVRNNAAAFDVASGAATAWDPNIRGGVAPLVLAIAVDGSTVYVGGDFSTVNTNTTRRDLAAFDAATGTVTAWAPMVFGGASPLPHVHAIQILDSVIYAGGRFLAAGDSESRNGLAAFDADGNLTAWDPAMEGPGTLIEALVIADGTAYAAGDFNATIDTATRDNFAAFDLGLGVLTAWDPDSNSFARALAVSGTTSYGGGAFTAVNGSLPRNRLAAFDSGSGIATAWDPDANGNLRALAAAGSCVVAGGDFTAVGGSPRKFLAAFGCECAERIFSDGFESGDTTAWSKTGI